MIATEAGKLGVLSVFLTVDGECNAFGPGCWSVFVRTRGCTVGCSWCDTKHSWSNKGGALLTPEELKAAIGKVGRKCKKVTITGGEPLEQDWHTLGRLIIMLIDDGYTVSIETAGTQDVEQFRAQRDLGPTNRLRHHPNLSFIVDYKLPSAGAKGTTMPIGVYKNLRARDRVKFVIANERDFAEAYYFAINFRALNPRTPFFFSPVHGVLTPQTLIGWMKKENCGDYDIRINLQQHKYIWPYPYQEEHGGIDFTVHPAPPAELSLVPPQT